MPSYPSGSDSRTRKSQRGGQAVKLHTIPGVKDVLDCSERHVYRLIAAGVLPVVDIAPPGSTRPKSRVRDDDLAAYIDANTRTATACGGAR